VLSTGLIVGVAWGAWHFLPNLESRSFTAAMPLALLLARLFSWLPAFRLLMVWVYERTQSALLAMLMHASLVAGATVIFMSGASAPEDVLLGVLAWAAVLWSVVAVVAVATHGQFARHRSARGSADVRTLETLRSR
jgi:hypothetical protein